MGAAVGGTKEHNSEINITPLIDIVLVMLIIFMVMVPLLSQQIEVSVPLTEEVSVEAGEKVEQHILQYSADGAITLKYMVDGKVETLESLGPEELGARLTSLFGEGGAKILFLDADERANYGATVALMDLARAHGVKAIGIMTEQVEDAPAEAAPAP